MPPLQELSQSKAAAATSFAENAVEGVLPEMSREAESRKKGSDACHLFPAELAAQKVPH